MLKKAIVAVSAALLLAGCGASASSTVTQSNDNSAVKAQYASFALELKDVMQEVATNANSGNIQATQESCVKLKVKSNEGLALPDFSPELDTHWDAAMSDFRDAGDACVRGDFRATVTYVNAGTAELKLATAAIPTQA
jgi:hypothetical protein